MQMEQLPDDALLMVMQLLDVADVLTCRLVCKRLEGLAAQPAVWRFREILHESVGSLMGGVLRVAPCVRLLSPDLAPASLGCRLTYNSSQCAASHLVLEARRVKVKIVVSSVANWTCAELAQAALMIRHQQTLGRLKEITVRIFDSTHLAPSSETHKLLVTLASTPGLEGLTVADIPACEPPMNFAALCTVAAPSLKRFRCVLSAGLNSFCKFILTQHSATLEHVDLGSCSSRSNECFASIAALLADMPNLRELTCRMYPGMEAVADSKSLRDLTIIVRREDQDGVQAAAMLLRRSHKLRAVSLKYVSRATSPKDCGVGLVEALAAARPQCLESLSIINGTTGELQLPQPLLSALPLLPTLRHLEVQPAPTELLLSINTASAPALQTLVVSDTPAERKCDFPCGHSYLHWDISRMLLSANPSLQLFVPNANVSCLNPGRGTYYCETRERRGWGVCKACPWGCHKGLRAYKGEYRGEGRKMMLIPRNIPK